MDLSRWNPRKLAKAALASRGRRLILVPHYAVKGVDFQEDLATLLPGPGRMCLDVGANVGQTIAKLLKSLEQPKIHAFEPSSKVFKTLEAKRASMGEAWRDVQLHRLALSDESGVAEFRNYEKNVLSSMLNLSSDRRNPFFRDKENVEVEMVPMQTLDEFVTAQGIDQIDLLKIDTQGADLLVLKGGQKIFERNAIRSVFVEMNFEPLYEGQGRPSEIIDFLAARGLYLVDIYEKYRSGGKPQLGWCNGFFARLQ